jgi:hypothetical protein
MIIIISKYLIPRGYIGMTLYPFIILKYKLDKEDENLMNHEKIHIRQQLEMLIVPFFIWYGLEYVYRFVQYRDASQAYRNLSFEREAYKNEKDLDYVKKRSFWNFLKYL